MDVEIKIDGLKELKKGFKLYPHLTKTFVNQAIYAYANEVAKYARTRIRSGNRS